MEKEKLEGMLIDYIDNKLNSVDRHQVEQELIRNPEAYKLYEELKEVMHLMDRSARLEPSVKLKTSFDALLAEELKAEKKTRTIFFQPTFFKVAAAIALLVIFGSIAFYIKQQNDIIAKRDQELKVLQLRTQEMLAMIANDQSASQRIQGVNVSFEFEKSSDAIVETLVKTMNEDPNTNVRLAALEALSRFINEKAVRQAIVRSLPKQKDPIVQIQLIQLLVKIKETGIVDDLQKIVDDEETMHAVKDEAYSAIMKLS
ncbi:MAG TPA: HEAT repeat domain-containing protein [Chryseosolibacter sp.]